jgi:hypothetical protein
MGETVDVLVVCMSWLVLRPGSDVTTMILFKLGITGPGSVVEVYRPSYAQSSMIGTQHRRMKTQSK